jgi:hypothetical protein
MQIEGSPKPKPQTQVGQTPPAGAAAGAAKGASSPGAASKSPTAAIPEQSTYVHRDVGPKDLLPKTRPEPNKPARQRDRTSLFNEEKPSSNKTNGVAGGEGLVGSQPRREPSVDFFPDGPLSPTQQLKVLTTSIWVAKNQEEDRIKADRAHPGAPSGYGGVTRKLPPEVQEKAEKLQKETTAADKGKKFLVVDKEGRLYVLCVEGQPDKKGVSVYEKTPPNPPA